MLTITQIAKQSERSYNSVAKLLQRYRIKPRVRTKSHEENLYDDFVLDFILQNCRKKAKSGKPAVFYKVSVLNPYRQWVVKACALKYKDAKGISDELNALGIEARAKPHSFSGKKK